MDILSEHFELENNAGYWRDRGYVLQYFERPGCAASRMLVSHLDNIAVIEYIYTRPEHQGCGHATSLIQEMKDYWEGPLYVLALEETAVFWLEKGFLQDRHEELESIYNNVYVMKRQAQ